MHLLKCLHAFVEVVHIYLALCQQRKSLSLTKILKLVDWLEALNKVENLNALGPLCLWQYLKRRVLVSLENAKSLSC